MYSFEGKLDLTVLAIGKSGWHPYNCMTPMIITVERIRELSFLLLKRDSSMPMNMGVRTKEYRNIRSNSTKPDLPSVTIN
jgi:hypothetical protein